LNVVVAPYFGCLFVASLFCLDGEDVDFGDCCHTVRGFFAPGNGMNDVSSSWKMEVSL
jgi:hypothetical protein